MNNLGRTFVLFGCLVCLSIALAVPQAKAGEMNQRTVITFSGPVELPGISLAAGTYVFRLVDYASDKNFVQVLSQDERTVLATIRSVPEYRISPAADTSIVLEMRNAGSPPTIKSWFFPGLTTGHRFVYPQVQPRELARTDQ
jgi:hypothetical protein